MQNWVKDMSAYVKSIDPAHLVMVSSWGYFGASTPELQPENPFDLTWRGIGNNAGVRCVAPCALSVRVGSCTYNVSCQQSGTPSYSLDASQHHLHSSRSALKVFFPRSGAV